MPPRIVVLGAGYAGVEVVKRLEAELEGREAQLVWVSDHDHHFVLHEAHRVLRKPSLQEVLTIPIEEVKSPRTEFVQREVDYIEDDRREVEFADGTSMTYDYLVDCLGSRTAFYGIEGLEEHALTLGSLADALEIHDAIATAGRRAAPDDPAQIVIGGAGLSGIQSAGEIAELRDARNLEVEIHLVEAMERILPGSSHGLQGRLEDHLLEYDVQIHTDTAVSGIEDSSIRYSGRDDREYDVLIWTGGITGLHEIDQDGVDVTDDRIEVDSTLQSDDERLFAVGDAALIEPERGNPPPPTAQAAWDAAEVAGPNVVRALRGRPLESWEFSGNGEVVSVGEAVVAHDVPYVPVTTFGGPMAKLLKKGAGSRWIANAGSWRRAARAWPDL